MKDGVKISDYNAYRVQTFARTQKTAETYEEGDVFMFFDDGVEKEILIVATILSESMKLGETNRLLTFCTIRELGNEWDDDYFICSAMRFIKIDKKAKIPFPLDPETVNALVNVHFSEKTSIKETKKTSDMWKQNQRQVDNTN